MGAITKRIVIHPAVFTGRERKVNRLRNRLAYSGEIFERARGPSVAQKPSGGRQFAGRRAGGGEAETVRT